MAAIQALIDDAGPEQTAADCAISYAIRGGAHRAIVEDNPLRLELMLLILLRTAVKTFAVVRARPATAGASPPRAP